MSSTKQNSTKNSEEASNSSHLSQFRPEETPEARKERLQRYREAFNKARSFEDDEEYFPYHLQTYHNEQGEAAQQRTHTENRTQMEYSPKKQQYQKEKVDTAEKRLQEAAQKSGVRLSTSMNIAMMILFFITFFCPAQAAPVVPSSAVRPIYADPSNGTIITPNTALCEFSFRQVNGGGAAATYNLTIGQPYANGSYCPILWAVIQANVPVAAVYIFTCGTETINAVKGDTHVRMETVTDHGTNIAIVDALQQAYPDIPFQRERICLQNGTAPSPAWQLLNGTAYGTTSPSRDVSRTATATGAHPISTGTLAPLPPSVMGPGPSINAINPQQNGTLPGTNLTIRTNTTSSFKFTAPILQ